MLSLASLFALFFRLLLLFQGDVVTIQYALPFNLVDSKFIQSENTNLHAEVVSFEDFGSIIPNIEIEERSEVESEDSSLDLGLGTVSTGWAFYFQPLSSLFTNKAIRGSRLPLYDFFHTWKIHLS